MHGPVTELPDFSAAVPRVTFDAVRVDFLHSKPHEARVRAYGVHLLSGARHLSMVEVFFTCVQGTWRPRLPLPLKLGRKHRQRSAQLVAALRDELIHAQLSQGAA